MPTHTHTSVVTHIDPEISTQKMINDSTPPPAPCWVLTGAGAIINVVSSLDGTSSGSNSATFTVPQNSHCQVYSINQNFCTPKKHFLNYITLAPVSVFSFSLERWDKMAVQSSLLHTTASPVCIWLGSVSVLNLTAITLVSACLVVFPLTPPNRIKSTYLQQQCREEPMPGGITDQQ